MPSRVLRVATADSAPSRTRDIAAGRELGDVWEGLKGYNTMARHIVMDPSGHSTFQFSPRSLADLANAERRFKKLLTKGYVPAYPEGGGTHRVPAQGERSFDPSATETIFIPALRGG